MINGINNSYSAFHQSFHKQAANKQRNSEFSVMKKEDDSKVQCDIRKLPGAEALTVASELPCYVRNNAIDILKISSSLIEEQEQYYRDRQAELGITGEIPVAVFNPVTEADMIAVLNSLKERFGISIDVRPSNGERLNGVEGNSNTGASPYFVTITVDTLRQMAGDPETNLRISENIQKWLDESSTLLRKTGDTVVHMIMQINDSSIFFGSATRLNTDREKSIWENAWSGLMKAFEEWTEDRAEVFIPEAQKGFGFQVYFGSA